MLYFFSEGTQKLPVNMEVSIQFRISPLKFWLKFVNRHIWPMNTL